MWFLWGWHWHFFMLAVIVAMVIVLVGRSRSGAMGGEPFFNPPPRPLAEAGGGGSAPGPTDQKYCSGCGAQIPRSAYQCPHCGAAQGYAPVGGKSRVAAVLFAILLGGIGVHKFYLGRIGQGVLYVLFCWTGVPTLVGIIEGVIYLTMTDEAFAAKYG